MKDTAKRVALFFMSVLIVLLLLGLCYVIYLQTQYYRIPDGESLEVQPPRADALQLEQPYTALTYNVGYGAFGPDYSFFLDRGTMMDGTEKDGKYGKARSEASVMEHIQGTIEVIGHYRPDFVLLQEVDRESDRSYKINEEELYTRALEEYSSVFALNFHSPYLFYPIWDPHGAVQGGMLSLSRHSIIDATHRSYPIDNGFFKRLGEMDRCFAEMRLPVANGKELVLLHSHMSASDKKGKVRKEQLETLCEVMEEEYLKGNYVIAGGDFNQALGEGMDTMFMSQQLKPEWVFVLEDTDLPEHFSLARADNRMEVPTCRTADMPYQLGVNYTTVVDGFIVSDNISYSTANIDTDFAYSDHNPVLMTFTLRETAPQLLPEELPADPPQEAPEADQPEAAPEADQPEAVPEADQPEAVPEEDQPEAVPEEDQPEAAPEEE